MKAYISILLFVPMSLMVTAELYVEHWLAALFVGASFYLGAMSCQLWNDAHRPPSPAGDAE